MKPIALVFLLLAGPAAAAAEPWEADKTYCEDAAKDIGWSGAVHSLSRNSYLTLACRLFIVAQRNSATPAGEVCVKALDSYATLYASQFGSKEAAAAGVHQIRCN